MPNSKIPEPQEQPAVRTTIVGGRPPGSGKPIGDIPRGIEILLKKASVDPNFRAKLLEDPEKAAKSIELKLDAAELTMLQAASKEQLAQIIDQTEVPSESRRALLKATTAAAILAVIGGASWLFVTLSQPKGITPENYGPMFTAGIAPDYPMPVTGSRPFDPSLDDPSLHEPAETPNENNDSTPNEIQ